MSRSPKDILKQYWGYEHFRPLQNEVIDAVLAGHDTLALMPTGGGKSVCYQVPALVQEGLCLVISPLIALMKDQVSNLRKKGITAYAIYSGMTRKEVINTLKVATDSNCRFLYVSPERLETSLFKEYLPGLNIHLIAVDESHCISQWGYDFRPPYLRISDLRKELPEIPVLALTASATPEVQEDICEKLSLQIEKSGSGNWKIFRQSFARPNLSYSVFKVDSKIKKLSEILSRVPGSGIVYCKSRKRTKEIAELLQMQKISADYYHAGLSQDERNMKQESWISDNTRVIVCTNAFGMGIDKPDVRLVIHADIPDCLENYYQEAGRAGRDEKKAYAVLLYDEQDIHELETLSDIRFPSLVDIINVYQSLAHYLQIPAGGGLGQSYDFDLSDFIKKFRINSHTAIYALKALEQEGWLTFNEQVFQPSTVQFTTEKNYLYDFEKDHPQWEPLIKSLLRAYEGIFDYPAQISEMALAGLLKQDVTEVISGLQNLHARSLIMYKPRKELPQIFLLQDRIRGDELVIDMAAQEKRKELFRSRVKTMIHYCRETAECRSRIIGNYFGDKKLEKCHVCDNCLNLKKTTLTEEEFEKIHLIIHRALKPQPLPSAELLEQLKGIKKEKAWKVIDFLLSENKIELDYSGWIRLK